MSEYIKYGGKWLAAARNWIQCKCRNGSAVTWGSGDVLEPHINVRQVEELAAWVADAANREADEMKADLNKAHEKYITCQVIVGGRNDRMTKLLKEWLDIDAFTNMSDLRQRTGEVLVIRPNSTTRAAMDELESGNSKSFSDTKDLMKDLNNKK